MKYLEAPNYGDISDEKSIFLAGSITGARNWQVYAKEKLINDFNVVNPRRVDFNVLDPKIEKEQITWEHHYLHACDILLFHFSHETVAPITLLEYGAALESSKLYGWMEIYISIDPNYSRKNDVIIQTELRNPKWSPNIFFSLDEAIDQILKDHELVLDCR